MKTKQEEEIIKKAIELAGDVPKFRKTSTELNKIYTTMCNDGSLINMCQKDFKSLVNFPILKSRNKQTKTTPKNSMYTEKTDHSLSECNGKGGLHFSRTETEQIKQNAPQELQDKNPSFYAFPLEENYACLMTGSLAKPSFDEVRLFKDGKEVKKYPINLP